MDALHEALTKMGVAEEPTHVWGARIEDREAQISFSPLGQQAPVEEKNRWATNNNDKRVLIYTQLLQTLPEYSVAMGGITTIDITRKGISKAFGIQQLSNVTHIPIPDMLYVGDALFEGGNDAVVIQTGIATKPVSGPEETATYIQAVLSKL